MALYENFYASTFLETHPKAPTMNLLTPTYFSLHEESQFSMESKPYFSSES